MTGLPSPAFAHASEAEMARILDFYGIAWEYEPHTFPILWNLDGDVVESFSPDFYLADLDLYLEMTTLRQKLVRKKNRKLRRLRELYPDVRIKLFYARDFRALMLKYGKLALVDTLSGSAGQVGLREVEVPVGGDGSAGPAVVAVAAAPPATSDGTMTLTARRRRRRRAGLDDGGTQPTATASAPRTTTTIATTSTEGPSTDR